MPKMSKYQKPKVTAAQGDNGKVGGKLPRGKVPSVPTRTNSPVKEFGRGISRRNEQTRNVTTPEDY